MARVIALILPLCLDTFAVAAALGMTRPTGAQRIRFSLLFAAFEGGMPVIGLLVGAGLGKVIGDWSEYLAIAALVGLGAYILWARADNADQDRVQKLPAAAAPAFTAPPLHIRPPHPATAFTPRLPNLP